MADPTEGEAHAAFLKTFRDIARHKHRYEVFRDFVTLAACSLHNAIRPDELEHIVQAMMPDETIARQLDIPATEPCLKLKRRTWKDGVVVTGAPFRLSAEFHQCLQVESRPA